MKQFLHSRFLLLSFISGQTFQKPRKPLQEIRLNPRKIFSYLVLCNVFIGTPLILTFTSTAKARKQLGFSAAVGGFSIANRGIRRPALLKRRMLAIYITNYFSLVHQLSTNYCSFSNFTSEYYFCK